MKWAGLGWAIPSFPSPKVKPKSTSSNLSQVQVQDQTPRLHLSLDLDLDQTSTFCPNSFFGLDTTTASTTIYLAALILVSVYSPHSIVITSFLPLALVRRHLLLPCRAPCSLPRVFEPCIHRFALICPALPRLALH
jgi:hypothetical protein